MLVAIDIKPVIMCITRVMLHNEWRVCHSSNRATRFCISTLGVSSDGDMDMHVTWRIPRAQMLRGVGNVHYVIFIITTHKSVSIY